MVYHVKPDPRPYVSPLVFHFEDYMNRHIYCAVYFDETTHVLDRIELTREPDCLWSRIYIGLGADGTVESSARKFTVPSGTNTSTINKGQLNSMGLDTLEDFNSYQITAGE